MRLFFTFMRAPLWLKAVMIVLIIGGGLVLRDGRVTDMAKAQAMAFAETQVGAMMDQALADAAEAMGMESLDLFGSLGVNSGSGAADGFVANNGHKTERVASPATKIDWKERALTLLENVKAAPLDYLPLLFSVLIGLIAFKMILSSIKRFFAGLFTKTDPKNKSKHAMETSVDLPGFDLDSAFADPKAAPDMKAILAQQTAKETQSGAGLSLRANVKATAEKVANAKIKPGRAKRSASAGGGFGFGSSRQPSALLKEKLQSDPFDRLTT